MIQKYFSLGLDGKLNEKHDKADEIKEKKFYLNKLFKIIEQKMEMGENLS